MSQPLTAADYCDWCKYAGLYLANISHADRYRTFQGQISRAGLAVKIVRDLLVSNPGGLDLQAWRNSDVYEMGTEAAFRIEQTALALEAIGAPRAAAKVRTLRNTSMLGGMQEMFLAGSIDADEMRKRVMGPGGVAKLIEEFRANVARAMPEIAKQAGMTTPEKKLILPDSEAETKEQIEHQLEAYVQAHEQELRADLAKYGDVRTEAGFDPDKRMEELDRIRRLGYDQERQREDVPKMEALMDKIETQLAKNPKLKPSKIAQQRRAFLECYRNNVKRPAAELLPEMQQWLKRADRFQDKYAHIFRPPATDDDALLQRLASIGPYEVDVDGRNLVVSWDDPVRLTCDWTEFCLSMRYPANKGIALSTLLDGYDRLCKRFGEHQAQLRHEVLESYRIYNEGCRHFGYSETELGPDGKPTEKAIFAEAGGGGIHLNVGDGDDPTVRIDVFFHVAWDDEHGLELHIEDEPEALPDAKVAASTVQIREAGPRITPEAVAGFEEEHAIKLPSDYRAFLLNQNGGRPEPDHLKIKAEWGSMPGYVERLYSLEPDNDTDLEDGLGDLYVLHCADDLPANLLPIGRVRLSHPGVGPTRVNVLLALSGRRAGKVLIPGNMMMPDGSSAHGDYLQTMMKPMFEQYCTVVAANFTDFLGRLTQSAGKASEDAL